MGVLILFPRDAVFVDAKNDNAAESGFTIDDTMQAALCNLFKGGGKFY